MTGRAEVENAFTETNLIAEKYLPEAKFAAALGKNRRTCARMREAGIAPPYVIIGRSVFYSKQGIVDWLAAREIRPRSCRSSSRRRRAA